MHQVDFDPETILVESSDGPAVAFIAYVDGQPWTCLASAISLKELAASAGHDEDRRTVFAAHRERFEIAARRLLNAGVGADGLVVLTGEDLRVLDGQYPDFD